MRKGFQIDRLSLGEWGNLAGSLLLGVTVLIGWHDRSVVLAVIAVAAALLGVLAWLACGTRRSPAVTLCIAVVQVPPVTVALVWLAVVTIAGSGGGGAAKPLALLGAALSAIGIYRGFRRESSPEADTPAAIETLNVSDLPVR